MNRKMSELENRGRVALDYILAKRAIKREKAVKRLLLLSMLWGGAIGFIVGYALFID